MTAAKSSAAEGRIALAVLDMAGTTVDERGSVRSAVLAAIDHVTDGNRPENFEDIFRRSRGGAKTAMFEALLGDTDLARHAHTRFEIELEQLIRSGNVQPIDGATTTFESLRDRGVKVALTTGFSTTTRGALLDHLGWTGVVDLVLSPEDVGRGRPYPDTVLTAVLRLEVDAVQAVAVVGDTANDLFCGTRAGASIVAGVLTGAHDHDTLTQAPHTHVLDTVAGLIEVIDGPDAS
ncbi:phosphonatase-like hydrolase [Rhodococcus koreensis]|uniref:phosphonatase-like hydrolase n=1 Tax=Rhodococcus koreensis TaxID=99653 RepID=UPI00366AC6E7